jgi:hypothetical protein
MSEHIKIQRGELIANLLNSWATHYEQMGDEELINEYLEYLSEDPDANITVEIIE